MEARKRKHNDQLAKITAAQEAVANSMSPESQAENAAKMATNKLLENSRNSSKSRSNSKGKSSALKSRSRSPLLTAKDKAVNGSANVYVNPATQLGNIASYGNQFDQPERVGYHYKPQNNGVKNDNNSGIKDFHSGKMLEQITKENDKKQQKEQQRNSRYEDNSDDEEMENFTGYTRTKSQSKKQASSSDSSDSDSSEDERRRRKDKKSKHKKSSSSHKRRSKDRHHSRDRSSRDRYSNDRRRDRDYRHRR